MSGNSLAEPVSQSVYKALMSKPAAASALLAIALSASLPGSAQSLRGITRLNQSQNLPSLTITGVTLSTTSDGALVETTTGLQRQKVEIPPSNTVISTYTGTAVKSVTLFDPRSYSNLTPGTSVNDQGPAEGYPYICGAAAPGQAANISGTYTDPGTGATMFTGPGEAPKNAWGDDQPTAAFLGTNNPNPLSATVVSAGTQFARQPWLSSGSFGNGISNTAPLQITPYPSGVPYPDCGG